MSNNNPTEHDETWLKLSGEVARLAQILNWKSGTLQSVVGFKQKYNRGGGTGVYYAPETGYTVTVNDAVTVAEANRDKIAGSYSGTYGKFLDEFLAARDAARDAQLAVIEHEANYTGWSRYFLVTSSAGLIHKSTDCSTCNKGRTWTQFALLPKLSGLGYEAAVEALGPSLCSVCYPEAPTTVVDGPKIPNRITSILLAQGQDEFTAELAKYNAKRAAKAAK